MARLISRQLVLVLSLIIGGSLASAQATSKSEASKAAEVNKKAAKSGKKDRKAAGDKAAPVNKKATSPSASDKAKSPAVKSNPIVEIDTTMGTITVELNAQKAPISTQNFLTYVNEKFYDNTIFHRVIDKFMIQGGGFELKDKRINQKPTHKPIVNEAKNGLKNDRGTIAMARTSNPNSATSQFFINHVHNHNLNHPKPDGHGYAVFGKVIKGMDVVDQIAQVKTTTRFGMGDFPEKNILIESIRVVK